MGFDNPIIPWRELERRLSDRAGSPSWSNGSRQGAGAPPGSADVVRSLPRGQATRGSGLGRVPYAELHAHSRFSFMDGSSNPDELVAEAARLELDALALTDRDGFYGVVRFAEAAHEAGLPTVFGAELTLDAPGSSRRSGSVLPSDRRQQCRSVVVLARDAAGYAALGTLVSRAHMAGRKGEPKLSSETFLEAAAANRGRWAILTGAHGGSVPSALIEHGPGAAARELDRLVGAAGAGNVFVELWDHGDPLDSHRNDALAELGVRRGVQPVCANAVRYAAPADRRLADSLAAVGDRRGLEEHDGWLGAWGGAHLRSGAEQARRFIRYPGAVEAAACLGRECAFSLSLVAPELPPYPVPRRPRRIRLPSPSRHRGRHGSLRATHRRAGSGRPGARSATSWT